MTKFKVGPAKTRDGKEAFIHKLDGKNKMFPLIGEVNLGGEDWKPCTWTKYGKHTLYEKDLGEDLLPNNLPEVMEYEVVVGLTGSTCESNENFLKRSKEFERRFSGKKVRIRIEAVGG
jgi:hypothetical protein